MIDRIAQFRQSFQTRKAEENDTHQYIQHHDPDFHKKKNNNKGGFKDPYDDLVDVSVAALITFLEGLLDQSSEAYPPLDGNAYNDAHTQKVRHPIDPAHAQAMNAYQARNPQAPTIKHSSDPKPQTALDKAAASLDQNSVKATIRDLQSLLKRGIDYIGLERGDGFLESIQNSIAKY